MKKQLCTLLLATLASLSIPAHATMITWELSGQLEESSSPDSAVGDNFVVEVSFDRDAALLQARSGGPFDPGTRYEYDASAMTIRVSLPGLADQLFTPTADNDEFLWLRDNSGDRAAGGEGAAVDGITFAFQTATHAVQVIFRGTILDIYNGGALPTTPDQRLLDLEISSFYAGTRDGSNAVSGRITGARAVSEPATIALLGFGLAAFGFARRKVR